jgi:uncharacterized protein with GYD domain
VPRYVSLINWTEQGVREFHQTVSRAEQSRELARRMGGELADVYWTVGNYDLVVIADFPDDQSATAFLLAVGSQGNLRTSTMRAFDTTEVQEIIAKTG